jgi:hypothetical protein
MRKLVKYVSKKVYLMPWCLGLRILPLQKGSQKAVYVIGGGNSLMILKAVDSDNG